MKSLSTISKIVAPHFFAFASFASVLSLFFYFTDKPTAVIIALVSFILFLALLLLKIWLLINTFLKTHHPKGYQSNFSFIKYHTEDGKHITHEVYKDIQCKQSIMPEYVHGFKWSGTIEPKISSNLQGYGPITKSTNPNDYDKVVFNFKAPLLYNQSAVLHVIMELNDCDGQAKPYIESKIDNPIQVIAYRIELLHKGGKYKGFATISKKPINSAISVGYQTLEKLSFNHLTKSYEYFLQMPEAGHFYRIEWEK